LVKGIFPQTGVATIGGQSGGGKSFHAVHLAVRLIPDCNQNVYIDRYRIKRHGGVLYLVLEGKPAFPLRVTAAFTITSTTATAATMARMGPMIAARCTVR
jgi:hypothetical protein